MRYCINCGETLIHLSVLEMNDYSHRYEETFKEAKYCPYCGTKYEFPVMPLYGELETNSIGYCSEKTKDK